MRTHRLIIAGLVAAILVSALAVNAAATRRTIDAGETFELTLDYSPDLMNPSSSITWYTVSGENLHFVVESPSGSILQDTASSIGAFSADFVTSEEGEYTLTWENEGTASVALEYTTFGFEEIQNAIDTFVLIAIIGGVVIVVIIIVVILLVVMGGKKKKAAMAPQATMPMGPPVVDGKCVRCGNPVDPAATWCPKCGAPLK